MKDLRGSSQLMLLFLVLGVLIVGIFLLAPSSIRLPYTQEIFPK